ncbi:methylated-DNA-[protein]-cysteine S-methyltransferase [Roseovarius halotolerans]|uniref:Methylated-DNA--protein-cysteine methyltransferase n=1 Tax=Roseovarius halotolerans TaxID=505353 RepID=A0A1X6Y4C3_9RHOB|nr:methylated-DNA--[protein]-cysteine S-methyltransferase [Roseovarius halotolerans]RKT35356.1 methylated-DNA-[protein]-cysteine S-methyltransferase [Roseovarius halotolerans]SLN10228.1 Methylated-DNA--protein-cysteine methyltransferase [Roseovarius halotolerans]
MNGLRYTHVESPVGDLLVAGTEEALHFLSFPTGHKAFRPRPEWRRDDAPFQEVRRQLDAYFAGDLRRFELALHLSGTEFQNSVWRSLADIPFGQTRSYGEIARSVGRPKASRAVGAANGSNPLPIILPCHRVIGAGGSLTGFGGGLAVKAFLLRHEGVLV